MKIYSIIEYRSIIKFIGFEINKKRKYIFIDSKDKGTLNNYIFISYKENILNRIQKNTIIIHSFDKGIKNPIKI